MDLLSTRLIESGGVIENGNLIVGTQTPNDRRLGSIGPFYLRPEVAWHADCGTAPVNGNKFIRWHLSPSAAQTRIEIRGDSSASTVHVSIAFIGVYDADVHSNQLMFDCSSSGETEKQIQEWIRAIAERNLPPQSADCERTQRRVDRTGLPLSERHVD
jgi:hypothetical protein